MINPQDFPFRDLFLEYGKQREPQLFHLIFPFTRDYIGFSKLCIF